MGEFLDHVGAPGAARSDMNFTLDDIAAAVIAAFPKLSMVERRVSLSTYDLLRCSCSRDD